MQVRVPLVLLAAILFVVSARAQTSTFTYQGSLKNGSEPANGSFDFEFRLFDAVIGGAQQGGTVQSLNVIVTNGSFTVSLDFGATALPGADRFLDISARTAGGGAFTPLTPRQKITSAPYAIKSANATSSDSLSPACVGCVTAPQIGSVNGASVSGSVPVASIPAGSGNYIQNTTTTQPASNFNISGTGTALNLNAFVVTASGQFNLSSNRILSAPGPGNLFAGINAGASVSSGTGNTFFGRDAGFDHTSGIDNSFFGAFAGANNTTSSNNSFFGGAAGGLNTIGGNNSFFGAFAGSGTTTGGSNSFFGASAGDANTTGTNNTVVGSSADVASGNLSFATAIGAGSSVSTSNTIALGRSSGIDDVRVYGDLTAASINSSTDFSIGNARILGNPGSGNLFAGVGAGGANTSGGANTLIGRAAGSGNTTGGNNTFIGHTAGDANTSGTFNTVLGQGANVGAGNLDHATAIGAGSVASMSNSIFLGRPNGSDAVRVPGIMTVNGGLLAVDGDTYVDGYLAVTQLNTARSTHICYDDTAFLLSACSSSIRYKENVLPFENGLDFIRRFRPVTFDWKERKERDLGLIAEEVSSVEPLLVTHNRNGEIEGVKYDQLTIVLINAVKEQQAQIEAQQRLIEGLRKLACAKKPKADVCK